MIIQCERCNTKFRLDDSKVTDSGVKVRCARCRHVFSVIKEQPEETGHADFGTMLAAASAPQEMSTAAPAPDAAPESPQFFFDSPFESTSFGQQESPEAPIRTERDPFAPGEEESFPFPGNEDFDAPSPEGKVAATAPEEPPPSGDAFDFDSFDFGAAAGDAGTTSSETIAFPDLNLPGLQKAPLSETEDSMFDFGDKSLFGNALATPASAGGESASLFSLDEFRLDETTQPAADQAVPENGATPEAGSQVTAEAAAHAREASFAPSETAEKIGFASTAIPPAPSPVEEEEELPPLSIPSRRKRSPLLAVLLGLLGVVAVAAVGFFSFATLPDSKGKNQAATEAGRITIRSVDASFVTNKESGELLVITGEAVNNFKEPRAAIQLKAMVYGGAGQVLTSKNAYAGNPLSKEQLATLPMEKLEAAMANQFGDSLANLEVASGKAIPFTIVIPKPAADAKDYGVEPAGSTVATGKQ